MNGSPRYFDTSQFANVTEFLDWCGRALHGYDGYNQWYSQAGFRINGSQAMLIERTSRRWTCIIAVKLEYMNLIKAEALGPHEAYGAALLEMSD